MTLKPAKTVYEKLIEAQEILTEVAEKITSEYESEKYRNNSLDVFFDQLCGSASFARARNPQENLNNGDILADALKNAYIVYHLSDKSGAGQITAKEFENITIEAASKKAQKFYTSLLDNLNISYEQHNDGKIIIDEQSVNSILSETINSLATVSYPEADKSTRVAELKETFLNRFEKPNTILNGEIDEVLSAAKALKAKLIPESEIEPSEVKKTVASNIRRS